MQNEVKKAAVKSVVSFVLHWNPSLMNTRRLIDKGAIGKPYYVEVDYWHGMKKWYPQYPWAVKQPQGGSSLLSNFARRAKGFGMRIVYYDVFRPPAEVEKALGARYLEFDDLLGEADFISIHVALTPETRHLFGAEQFRRMKPTSVLVNSSRGPVIDEAALADALRAGGSSRPDWTCSRRSLRSIPACWSSTAR